MYKVTVLFESGNSRTRWTHSLDMARFICQQEQRKRACVFWMIMLGQDIIDHA